MVQPASKRLVTEQSLADGPASGILSATIEAGGSRRVNKAITNANVTLTAAEAGAAVLELTGATAAITVTVPTGKGFTLVNSTNYDHNVKRAGATKTVLLLAGDAMEVLS